MCLLTYSQRCQIPSNPPYSKYKFIGETANNYRPGDYAQNYNVLEISCESEYKVNPIFQNHSICINGKWLPSLPHCLRACPSLTSVISTRVNCKWNDPDGNDIPLHNCINPVEGTTVYLSCNPFFEEHNILKNPVRVCREGRWDPAISLCYPICGLKRPKAKLNIINGSNTIPGDYPWQVGIYNTQKDLICGGSILDYRVIVSAAHCFTDHDGNVNPTENYFVAAGKYYRKYDDDRDKYSQYSNILKIHVPSRYRGVVNLQGYDIAILILADPFKISLHVQPVCIELNEESPDLHLSLNKNGIVTGWGYTQSGRELAEELQEVIIPYVPFDECFKTVPIDFRRYITHDSICGGYTNLCTSVCAGDSGGGLIFKKLNADRHYIKGIVSVSPATEEGVCNSNQISVFTSIASHTNFVRKHLAFNQIRQNIECTQDECLNSKLVNTSVEKCNDNNRFDCKNFNGSGAHSKLTPSLVFQHRLLPKPKKCGKILARMKQFPWTARIIYSKILYNLTQQGFGCGGSLINTRYVLTAASCKTIDGEIWKYVVLGRYESNIYCSVLRGNINCNSTHVPVYSIESYVIHEGIYLNGIALLRLNRNVVFDVYIQPICLPTESISLPINSTIVMLAGWQAGRADPDAPITLTVISPNRCKTELGITLNTEKQYCAARLCENIKCEDNCTEALGSPAALAIKQPSRLQWIQLGIPSISLFSCNRSIPEIHTRVSQYLDWIVDNIED